jgi:hypothetical protein
VRVVCGPGGSVEHSIPTGPDQLKNLPWTNISQVKIAFSENVFVEMWSLAVNASESHRFIDFSYDADSFTGTWTFMEPLGADSLQLVLDESVFDMAENVLDGDWFDRASEFPSGNGRPGGAFRFGINVLPGDVDGDNVVGSGDYSALMGQFGLRQDNLATDLNRDGRVGLADFAIIRGNLGNTLPAAAPPATPIAAAPAPVVPVISQLLDNDENSANTDPIAAAASAPAIDLLIESPSANAYIPGAQAISRRLPTTTLYRAATAGYDLRPLSDDLAADSLADDLLIDVLAESPLAVRL